MPPIIFIDDEPIMCRAFSLALRRLGREVKTFTDPTLALEFLATSQRPAVVICDYRMPALTGLEVRQRLPADL
ncbi:MAG: response regulator, partial [Phycisphaerales bacterium]|nr:response regulator [Phycisphaerales bacterium]